MKTATVKYTEMLNRHRIDSTFYLSEGSTAIRTINKVISAGTKYVTLGDRNIAKVWQPKRNVLVYAGDGEDYVPYLQPYDILEYFPTERARLSIHQDGLQELKVSAGTILQTCSGRNLGPLTIADPYLEQFVFGSDLIRVNVQDVVLRNFIFAFFNTRIGQALLHSNKTGSVIDHLGVQDIEAIRIPVFSNTSVQQVSSLIMKSFEAFSTARTELAWCADEFSKQIGVSVDSIHLREGWTVKLQGLSSNRRIDAAYYNPAIYEAVQRMKASGGVLLARVAKASKPGGRRKTNYVEEDYGRPLLSGRQLLQANVVGQKYLPYRLADDYSAFLLKKGMVAYPADGRVEGRLGTPVLIADERENWYASVHIGRIQPLEEVNPGYLYLAMSHPVVQAQLSALACGSVVDSVYSEDVANIILPKQIEFPYERVVTAWDLFAKANTLKQQACELLLMNYQ